MSALFKYKEHWLFGLAIGPRRLISLHVSVPFEFNVGGVRCKDASVVNVLQLLEQIDFIRPQAHSDPFRLCGGEIM